MHIILTIFRIWVHFDQPRWTGGLVERNILQNDPMIKETGYASRRVNYMSSQFVTLKLPKLNITFVDVIDSNLRELSTQVYSIDLSRLVRINQQFTYLWQ